MGACVKVFFLCVCALVRAHVQSMFQSDVFMATGWIEPAYHYTGVEEALNIAKAQVSPYFSLPHQNGHTERIVLSAWSEPVKIPVQWDNPLILICMTYQVAKTDN